MLPAIALLSIATVIALAPLEAGLKEAFQTNMLRVRLERVVHDAELRTDSGLLNLLGSGEFATENRRVAWLGGYYVLKQTGSVRAATHLWALAPEYSSEMLTNNSRRADDKTKSLMSATVASELSPASLEGNRALVTALVANENWRAAADQLDALLSVLPGDAEFTAMRGFVEYRRGGSVDDAEQLLLRAKTLDPDVIRTYLYLDNFYRSYGTLDQVEAALLEGIKVSSRAKSLYSYDFMASLVDVYLRQGKLDKVPAYLKSGLSFAPSHEWWNSLAGKYYLAQGKYAEAREHFAVAARTSQDPGIFVGWGDSLRGTGDQANARQAYCDALMINPTYSSAVQRLAEIGAECS